MLTHCTTVTILAVDNVCQIASIDLMTTFYTIILIFKYMTTLLISVLGRCYHLQVKCHEMQCNVGCFTDWCVTILTIIDFTTHVNPTIQYSHKNKLVTPN